MKPEALDLLLGISKDAKTYPEGPQTFLANVLKIFYNLNQAV